MTTIKESVNNPTTMFTLNGLDYQKGMWEIYYVDITVDSNGDLIEAPVRVGVRNQHRTSDVLQSPLRVSDYKDGGGTPYSDLDTLITDLSALLEITTVVASKPYGMLDYNDTYTTGTPIVILSDEVPVALTNDGLGSFTNKLYLPDGVTDLWDTTGQTFDFSELSLGSIVHYRLDLSVTTTSTYQDVHVQVRLAIGGAEYVLLVDRKLYKTAKEYSIVTNSFIYMGDANTRDNGAKFEIYSDGDATVVVNGWALGIHLY